jgi:large conductance mechanosensitive channel
VGTIVAEDLYWSVFYHVEVRVDFPQTLISMFKEFKAFIMRGNVLELAVAVIIAGAFGAVVTSFTNDVIMPPIGAAMGDVDFSELAYQLTDDVVDADGNVVAEGAAIRYGKFIQTIIDFLIIAFIIFMIVRSYNKMTAKKEAEETPPAPDPGPTEIDLLREIRDHLAKQ